MIETSTRSDYLDVLRETALSYRRGDRPRPSAATVATALLQAEKAAKQQRLTYPFTGLSGQWRLCFTTGVRKLRRGGIALGKGFYVPKFAPAAIGFEPIAPSDTGKGEISNQVQVGALRLRFTGPAKYLGKKNLLAFDFIQVQVLWGDRSLYSGNFRGGTALRATFDEQPIAKLPFFAFFLVTNDFIAARGRGGGLALWIREN